MITRCKMRLMEKHLTPDYDSWENGQTNVKKRGGVTVKFRPDYSDKSEENKRFFSMTPSGEISLHVAAEVADTLELGSFYYVDFEKVS